MESRMRSWLLLVVCVSLLVGCSEPAGPETVPVSGTVTFNGEPLVGAQVVFSPAEGGARNAMGTTDAQGKYQLSMFGENDGTIIGPHTVSISPAGAGGTDTADAANPDASYDAMMGGAAAAEAAPKEGEFAAVSDLKADVTAAGPNVFDYKLPLEPAE